MILSEKAEKLIMSFEGLDQPFNWPRGDSGISLGRGYDLGYVTAQEFVEDWKGVLSPDYIERLREAIGLIGINARNIAYKFADMWITEDQADFVFKKKMLPKHMWRTIYAFPGVENLPQDVQGALVSLVYNRGTSMVGERRKEMKAIQDAVAVGNIQEIANQIRQMKRLWVNKGLDGLLARRDAEAGLVESCIEVQDERA